MRLFSRLLPFAILACAAIALMMPHSPAAAGPLDDEARFVSMINDLRAANGLDRLAVHGELRALSRQWSSTMADRSSLEHAPDLAVGVSADWDVLGENVGVHTVHDLDALFQAFVNSPGHRDNLLDPRFDYVGVGVVYGPDGRIWTTHRFMSVAGVVAAPPTVTAPPVTAPATTAPPTTPKPPTTPAPRRPPTTTPTTAATTATTAAPTTSPAPTTEAVRPTASSSSPSATPGADDDTTGSTAGVTTTTATTASQTATEGADAVTRADSAGISAAPNPGPHAFSHPDSFGLTDVDLSAIGSVDPVAAAEIIEAGAGPIGTVGADDLAARILAAEVGTNVMEPAAVTADPPIPGPAPAFVDVDADSADRIVRVLEALATAGV